MSATTAFCEPVHHHIVWMVSHHLILISSDQEVPQDLNFIVFNQLLSFFLTLTAGLTGGIYLYMFHISLHKSNSFFCA